MKKTQLLIVALFLIFATCIVYFGRNQNIDKYNHPTSDRVTSALKNSSTSRMFEDLIPKEISSEKNPGYKTSPEFRIGQYVIATPLPQSKKNLSLYEFKTDFSDQYISGTLAKLIGPSLVNETMEGDIVSYSSDYGYAQFNKKTGALKMSSIYLQLPFSITQPRDLQHVKQRLTDYMIHDIGIVDDTVTLSALYQRSNEPDITYYEFHRNAEKLNIPIFNPVGILNVAENLPLNDLKLGASQLAGAADPSIVFASDYPGKARQSEFNTMTVAISNSGLILSIDSNIRPIEKVSLLSDRGLKLYDVKEAMEELQKNGAYYNITVPVGEGYINLDKVYRNNQFVSDEAHVTDVILAYLEKPAGIKQKYLQPVYIIRGFAETETGVRVAFSQTIPALEKFSSRSGFLNRAWTTVSDRLLPSAHAQESDDVITLPCDDGSIGECRIIRRRITPTPTTPITPTLIIPSVTPPPPEICVLLTKDGVQIEQGIPLYIPGLGTVYYFPTALPNGPLAIPRGQNGVYSDRTFEKFQVALDNHLLSVAAERILADPSIPYYVSGSNTQNSIKLNTIFPDVSVDLDAPTLISSWYNPSSALNIKTALYRVHNPVSNSLTLDGLLHLPRLQGLIDHNVPLEQIWLLKQNLKKSYSGASIFSQYQLTNICEFASTVSPYVYFYPKNEVNLHLDFTRLNVSYIDPIKAENVHFTANPQSMLDFNGVFRDRLHYEYKNITFMRPKYGWVVQKNQVIDLAKKKFLSIGLNNREFTGLLQELDAGLATIEQNGLIFVSILPSTEVDQKLPLEIFPKPSYFNRVHLYIEALKSNQNLMSIEAPTIPKVTRDGYYVIETGVYIKEI